jgi:cysteine desulfuration protein SufE
MITLPAKLTEILEDFTFITDRNEQMQYLTEIADRFAGVKVPASISTPPHPTTNQVPQCQSDAYVWAIDQPDGTQQYTFDVLNPQGVSAMAMCVILGETLSGQPLAQVAAVPEDIVFQIFGNDLSMGKGQGLTALVRLVTNAAKQKTSQS